MKATRLFLALLVLLVAGCASHTPAPVVDRSSAPVAEKPRLAVPAALVAPDIGSGYHVVKKGETLYGIALDYGLDYKDLATWNNLENLNLIRVGQQLRITPPDGGAVAVAKPVITGTPVEIKQVAPTTSAPLGPASAASTNTEVLKREPKGGKVAWSDEALANARQGDVTAKPVEIRPEAKPAEIKVPEPKTPEPKAPEKPALSGDDVDWMWPANGKLIAPYAEGGGKGLDIAGKTGDPVLAAADGVVSYAGAGLRGYGNLIVLRHNATFLSVYAHNSKLLVKEKDPVKKGQKIAEMGSTDAESPRLHFEIRRQGKPADPQKFLPAR